MNWWEVAALALMGLGLVGGMTRFFWGQIQTIRTNDLRHLEERLIRIEDKLDDHIIWHSRNGRQ